MKDEMTKLTGTTPNLTDLNTEKVKELFPQAVTEGKIDFDTLKSLLGEEVDDTHEKYQFTWHGKSKAIKLAQSPSRATLLPSKDDSKNWDTTENLYIEGDNLEVLKQLQKTYFGKIKMIYIDPPYNTGGDFVYKDDFKDTIKNYKEQTNQAHKANAETSGRYHTDWLNMMYPRLMLAKNLLSDDGVIFISIDDNEQSNLKKMCDEIFGESNFIAHVIPISNPRGSQSSKDIAVNHEYVLIYKKTQSVNLGKFDLTEKQAKEYSKRDEFGEYREIGLRKRGADSRKEDSPTLFFAIYYDEINDFLSTTPIESGIQILPKLSDGSFGRWRWSKAKIERESNQLICRQVNRNGSKEWDVFQKDYLNENKKRKPMSVWSDKEINNEFATEMMGNLFEQKGIFNYTKSMYFLKKLMIIGSKENSTILDFFSGSATTAHAVMKLNAEDGGNRKFIMVQLPELTDEKSEAHKAGYENICEIGKERIRRAGKQIQEDMAKDGKDTSNLDVGFKVFKLDSTNIKEWDSSQTLNEPTLLEYADIFKDGRTQEDVLYEILLKYGVFNMPVKEIQLNDKTAYDVAEGNTLICLADDINEEDIQVIGKLKPQNVIFKESGFKDDNVKLNAIYTLEKQGVEDIQAI